MDKLTRLASALGRGEIDRRSFMQGALALGLTSSAATVLMSKSVRAAPKKGGHYRVGKGHGQTTDSLDPNTWENGFMLQFGYAVQDYLTEIDDQSGVIPRLAESWEASADATSWTFKLKKGAEFHNGKTVEAQDVIDSINIHRGEDSKSPAKPIVDPIEDIKADNERLSLGHPAEHRGWHRCRQPGRRRRLHGRFFRSRCARHRQAFCQFPR
jgi:peptide/nickel transport system substrate-binding protein